MDKNTQEAIGHPVLCTVRTGEYSVKNLLQMSGTTLDMPVCEYLKTESCT